MKKVLRGFVRTLVGGFVCALGATSALAVNFIGEGGSYSGDLAVDGNWQGGKAPLNGKALFDHGGTLTVGSTAAFSEAQFTGTSLSWALTDFGSDRLTIQDLTVTGTGSCLALTNGTMTITNVAAGAHIYIGDSGCGSNVLEVGKDATLELKSGSLRIGGYAASTVADAPGNALRVSEGGTFKSSVNIMLGDGGSWGNPDCRLEVQGADLFEMTGSALLSVGYRQNAHSCLASFRDTERVSIGSAVNVGMESTATNCAFVASNVTHLAVGGNMTLKNGARAEIRDVADLSLNGITINGGALAMSGLSGVTSGLTLSGKVDLDFRDIDTLAFPSALELASGSSAVFRDIPALTLPGVTLAGGSSLLVSNATAVTMSGTVTVGDATGGAYAELHMPSDFDPRKAKTAAGAAGAPNVLVYDAGGRTLQSTSLNGFVSDYDRANVTVELRNGNYQLTNVNRYRMTQPNQTYVIGPGATLEPGPDPFASSGQVLYLEGQSEAFGDPVEGIALVVDGGTVDFTEAPAYCGGIYLGSGGWGYGSIFEAKNGATVILPTSLAVGAESGIADACRVSIASEASVTVGSFIMLTSDNRVTISNATVSATNCKWPDSGSLWPNNATAQQKLGPKAGTPREATNNVFRFEGAAPRLAASADIISYQNANQSTEIVLDFALPASGYEAVPVTAGNNITFQGKVRLRVDASAYTGPAVWITLLKTTNGSISIPDWSEFVAEVPESVLVRFKDSSHKEVQVCVGDPFEFVGEEGSRSGDLDVAGNWVTGEVPAADGRGDFLQGGTLSAGSPVTFLEAYFLGNGNTWSVETGSNWSLADLFVGANGADNQRVVIANGTALNVARVTVGSAGATNNVLSFTAGSSLAATDITVQYDNAAEIRDVANLAVSHDIKVVGGGSLVMSNLTSFTFGSGTIYVGDATGGASAELCMPATFNPRKITVGTGAAEGMRSLVYDASGASITNNALDLFVNDALQKNVTVELRNGDYWLIGGIQSGQTKPDPQRYRPVNPYRKYVIGSGATMTMPETRYGPVFHQEGQSAQFGSPLAGIAVVVDGGTMRLLTTNTGGYDIGSAGWGVGNVFAVQNDGLLWADADFRIGAESGVADFCDVRVASGGTIRARDFYILTSNNRTVISNGTISVGSCYWPSQDSCWPNNAYFEFKTEARPATNNVIRFEGPDAHLLASGAIYGLRNTTKTPVDIDATLEFVIPEGGYDRLNPPIQAGTGITFQGKLTIRVDPTAYAGEHRWMTLMRTTSGTINVNDLDLSEVPESCKVRLSADGRRLSVGLGEPRGMMLLVR